MKFQSKISVLSGVASFSDSASRSDSTRKLLTLVVFGIVSVLAVSSAKADIIYSQAFDAATPAQLHGSTVTGGTEVWNANTLFQTDGTLSGLTRSMALLPFTPVGGEIYELSMDVTNLESGFMGIGFADEISFAGGNANADRMITGSAVNYGMMFLNPFQLSTNGMAFSTYSSGSNIMDSNVFLTGTVNDSGPFSLKIVMDTTDTNWTTEYFIDGDSKNFFTHVGALTNIDSVGINTGLATDATTFSNFQLQTLSAIPEPSSLAMFALSGLVILARRRRS